LKQLIQYIQALTAIFALTSASYAQMCPMPDGLDGGPCCAVAQPQLPNLPQINEATWNLCWQDCDLSYQEQLNIRFSAPSSGALAPGCAPLRTRVRMTDSAGNMAWRGRLRMQYSRTWVEYPGAATSSQQLQIWRFLINGDLVPGPAAGNAPCPVPTSVLAFGRARFTGYIDYAFDCNSGQFANAVWMLNHACDKFEHEPGYPRAGIFDPNRAYTFVGPASQFTPSAMLPIEGGGGNLEAIRSIDHSPIGGLFTGPRCLFEEDIQHALDPQGQLCACSPAGTMPQYSFGTLSISGNCGSAIGPDPNVQMPSFVSMGIGRFSDPNRYPGEEALRWNTGRYMRIDGCTGVSSEEAYFGVTTIGGWEAQQVKSFGLGAFLPLTFIDQSNSLRQGNKILNVPYYSDHVINLNH